MKIISSHLKKPLITIIGCLHGDELFGRTVFSYFRKHRTLYPNVKLILAHEAAIRRGIRFIEQDLNRSFPGKPHGMLEERLATALLKEVRSSNFVLDIHTTTSDIRMTPIITKRSERTMRITKLCSSREVILIHPPLGEHALVNHVDGGVSLEFNRHYARTKQALDDVVQIVDRLIADRHPKSPHKQLLYHVTRTIPRTAHLPKNVANFKFIRSLNLYPFLLYEKAYPDFVAFGATKRERI